MKKNGLLHSRSKKGNLPHSVMNLVWVVLSGKIFCCRCYSVFCANKFLCQYSVLDELTVLNCDWFCCWSCDLFEWKVCLCNDAFVWLTMTKAFTQEFSCTVESNMLKKKIKKSHCVIVLYPFIHFRWPWISGSVALKLKLIL